jgi:TRAP-type C4-dicarboxylate transport system permease small subunit
MQAVAALLERITRVIEIVSGVLLGVITVLITVSAVGRYLLAWPVPDAFDLSRLLLGAAIMWGFASVGYHGSHIKVDLFAEMMPRGLRRAVNVFAWSVLLLFTLLLTWKLLVAVLSAEASGVATMDLRLPHWPFFALVWAGVAAANLAILARLILVAAGLAGLDAYETVADAAERKGG